MGGFMGKYMLVNLSDRTWETIELGEEFYMKYLSGYGLGAAIIAERQAAGIDPLSAESYLGVCSGFLTGTGLPFTGRFMVVGKSPLTGGWGDANAGGYLSREIKRTGVDAVFFTGAADSPVWVHITETGVDFKNASSLWGKDINETEDAIKNDLDDKKVQVAVIGVAGEKCSLISGIATDGGRIAARSGFGAVMGSKKLKAVSFSGNCEIPVADKERVKSLAQQFIRDFKKKPPLSVRLTLRFAPLITRLVAKTKIQLPPSNDLMKHLFKTWGTPGLTVLSGLVGDTPVKNWGGSVGIDFNFNQLDKLAGEKILQRQKRRYRCQSCPMGCGGEVKINSGRYKEGMGHKPEYETIGVFGPMLLNDDVDALFEINEMCNRAGIDTISTGGVVAFVIECVENGIIDPGALGNIDIGWGKAAGIIKLTEMIINREGIGDLLADGVKKAAETIGKGSEKFAIHAGGQELGMHDSRRDPGLAVAYQCDPTPGRHTITSNGDSDLRSGKEQFPEVSRMVDRVKSKQSKKLALSAATGIYTQLINVSGVCLFAPDVGHFPMVEFLNAVTGWNLSADDYFKTGRRILNLRKAISALEGVKPRDTRLPSRAVGNPALSSGPIKGMTVDIDTLEKEYFTMMGWDLSTGGPKPETLREMEIDHLIDSIPFP